jgi:hypothetical protein
MTARLAIGLAAGLGLGLAYIALLRANIRLYLAARAPRAASLHLVRFALVVVGLASVAQLGAAPLIGATLAFTVVAFAATRREVR